MAENASNGVELEKPARQVEVSWLTRLNEYQDPRPNPSSNPHIKRWHFIEDSFRRFNAKVAINPSSIIGRGDSSIALKGSFRRKDIAVLIPNMESRISDLAKEGVSVGLMQQAEILKSLSDHPNIPSLVGAGPLRSGTTSSLIDVVGFGPEFALGMEHVNGLNIEDTIFKSGKPFSFSETRSHLRDISSALEYTHATLDPYGQPLVHGDISTRHIQFDMSGKPYLIDWGTAVALSEHNSGNPFTSLRSLLRGGLRLTADSEEHQEGEFTLSFCAPEILNLRSGELITPKVDTYSLAATAYYMLTGQHPFLMDKEHLAAIGGDLIGCIKDGTVKYVPISERELEDLPEDVDITKVDRAIEQALSFDPEKRQDVADFYRQAFVESFNME